MSSSSAAAATRKKGKEVNTNGRKERRWREAGYSEEPDWWPAGDTSSDDDFEKNFTWPISAEPSRFPDYCCPFCHTVIYPRSYWEGKEVRAAAKGSVQAVRGSHCTHLFHKGCLDAMFVKKEKAKSISELEGTQVEVKCPMCKWDNIEKNICKMDVQTAWMKPMGDGDVILVHENINRRPQGATIPMKPENLLDHCSFRVPMSYYDNGPGKFKRGDENGGERKSFGNPTEERRQYLRELEKEREACGQEHMEKTKGNRNDS